MQVSVTVAPSSKFCALANEAPNAVLQTRSNRRTTPPMRAELSSRL
jgi:hypothetical protein